MTLLRSILRPATLVVVLLLPVSAHAQVDLLKRGQDVLKSIQGNGTPNAPLSDQEIANGLREALKVGVSSVVAQVGATNGYYADPRIHVPLPATLEKVQTTLGRIGMSDLMDDLELKLNRAAEAAAPEARDVFWQAIKEMSLSDVRQIYEGPPDAATRYFERTMSEPLKKRMRPIVDASLNQVGAVRAYNNAMGQYKAIPFVPDVKANLSDHVLERALHGLFLYLAEEEAAIRQNPAKRTTELLRRVFGNG